MLGGIAFFVGICVVIFLPDSPVHAYMLTKEEKVAALERVRDDQGGTENHTFKKDQVLEAFIDSRTWLIVLTTLLSTFRLNRYIHVFHLFNVVGIPNRALGYCATSISR